MISLDVKDLRVHVKSCFTCGIRANGYKHLANPESVIDYVLEN